MNSILKGGLLFFAGVVLTLLVVFDATPWRHTHLNQLGVFAPDRGAWANAQFHKLRGRPGSVSLQGGGEIRTTIRVGVGQVLEFGPGLWRCSASPCIELDNASQVKGAGIYRTRLDLADRSAGPIFRSRGFLDLIPLNEVQAMLAVEGLLGEKKELPGIKYMRISGLTLDGRKDHQESASNGIELYGYWFTLEDISIERFGGYGLVTQFIPGASVNHLSNDAMESHINRIKLLSNNAGGWLFRGPHDSIATGLIAANNGGWAIDVQHREGHYSGGGMMLNNTHLYGNANGLRTEAGANIIATGLESEANQGTGLLLRSNDSVIQGIFYANGGYGVQIGDEGAHAGVNVLNVQVHNNALAQIRWHSSAGYNQLSGSIFPNNERQKFFEGAPTRFDLVSVAGPYAVQYFPGGMTFDSDRNVYNAQLK